MPLSGFVVIRHPEAGVGTVPVSSLESWGGRGWTVVSDERAEPYMFNLPDFAEPAAEPQPETPAEPESEE